jgi:hypothetical protein
VSQKITLSGQLYPEENSPTQQFFLEYVLPTADKFVVEIKKQYLVGSLIQEDKNKPSVVIGHWITLEKPGYPPFSTSTTFKAFGLVYEINKNIFYFMIPIIDPRILFKRMERK